MTTPEIGRLFNLDRRATYNLLIDLENRTLISRDGRVGRTIMWTA